MDSSSHPVRRATLDDLPVLQGLWEVARLPGMELEKHLTEFQLATRPDGVVMAAIALRTMGAHGWLHSEAGYASEPADEYRQALWTRLQTLARNHGLTRLWMTSEPARFWRDAGFHPAATEDLQKLPAAMQAGARTWHTLALKSEVLLTPEVEQQFERLQQQQQVEAENIRRQAERLKWLAGSVAVVFFVGAIWLLLLVLHAASRRSRRR